MHRTVARLLPCLAPCAFLVALAPLSCGGPQDSSALDPQQGAGTLGPAAPAPSTAPPAPSAAAPAPRPHNPGCAPPTGVSNAPRSIAETVAMLNAMPKPVTLPCFLEALARPLEISATNSVFSAQPSQGPGTPRIFLFRDPNTMSIVPAGSGAPLLEFGEQRPNYRSLKAEIEFPVIAELSPTAPFERVLFSDQVTTCGVCHSAEVVESNLSGVNHYVSQSLRPFRQDLVSTAFLQQELAVCDRTLEPGRCAMLDGLLGWGPVTDHAFPADMATFGS